MFYRYRQRLKRFYFNWKCKEILDTPPIPPCEGRVAINIMTSHNDVLMAIVAVKSLYRYVQGAEIYVLDDGSLTSKDKAVLKHHLSPRQIVPIDSVPTGKCPKGNCWERFLFTADLVQHKYVFQIDSDTLTINEIPEVQNCIVNNISFASPGGRGSAILPMEEICKRAKEVRSDHVVVVAEKNFDRLARFQDLNYVRGCAAYMGYAQGSFTREQVERFSTEMESIIGVKWRQWGSEQVAANYIIANTPGAVILPYEKYTPFEPGVDLRHASYVHFIGTYRFKENVYVNLSRQVIKQLLEGVVRRTTVAGPKKMSI